MKKWKKKILWIIALGIVVGSVYATYKFWPNQNSSVAFGSTTENEWVDVEAAVAETSTQPNWLLRAYAELTAPSADRQPKPTGVHRYEKPENAPTQNPHGAVSYHLNGYKVFRWYKVKYDGSWVGPIPPPNNEFKIHVEPEEACVTLRDRYGYEWENGRGQDRDWPKAANFSWWVRAGRWEEKNGPRPETITVYVMEKN